MLPKAISARCDTFLGIFYKLRLGFLVHVKLYMYRGEPSASPQEFLIDYGPP